MLDLIKTFLASLAGIDRDSERIILEMFYQHVYQSAYYISQDRNQAQDILLTTFKKAFQHLHKVQRGERLGAWLASIATRAALDKLHKTKKSTAPEDFVDVGSIKKTDYIQTIENLVEEKYLKACLLKGVDKLKPDHKQVLLLRYQCGMGIDEMALALDWEQARVQAKIKVAKLTLLFQSLGQPEEIEKESFIKDKKTNLDKMFQDVLSEHMNHCPFPPLTAQDAWEQLREPQRYKLLPSLSGSVNPKRMRAVLFLVLVIAILWPAVSLWSSIDGSTEKASSAPPAEEILPDQYDVVSESSTGASESMGSLLQAQEVVDFAILIPKNVPSGLQLSQVKVMRDAQKRSKEVYLIFQGEQRGFVVSEMAVNQQVELGTVVNRSGTDVLDLYIKDRKAQLFLNQNGISKLVWKTDQLYISVEGRLTKEEILAIAESIET